jgi:hypothetical protein
MVAYVRANAAGVTPRAGWDSGRAVLCGAVPWAYNASQPAGRAGADGAEAGAWQYCSVSCCYCS